MEVLLVDEGVDGLTRRPREVMDDSQLVRALLGVSAQWAAAEGREWRVREWANFGTRSQLFVDFCLHSMSMFGGRWPILVLTVEARTPVPDVNSLTTCSDDVVNEGLVRVMS